MSLFARPRPEDEKPDKVRKALEAAIRVSEIAASAVALPEAVRSVVATAIDLLEAEQGSIMLLDDSGRNLVLAASAGSPTGVSVGHRLPVGDGVAGRVMATGRPLRLGAVDGESFVNFVPKERAITSSLVAPLRAGGRPLGVLSVATSGAPFSDEDLRLAQMFADQAAGLIHRTRLHEQAERRSSDLAALIESSKGLLGMLDLDSLLQAILDGATRLGGEKEAFVCLFDGSTGALTRGVFRGLDKGVIRAITELPETKAAVAAADLAAISLDGRHFVALGLRSSQGTTGLVVVGGDPILVSERGHLLKAFAQQSASAIGGAELYSLIGRKESELGSIIQSVPTPIILVDKDGNVASLNPSAEQLFGLSTMFAQGAPVRGSLGSEQLEDMACGTGDIVGEVQFGVPTRVFKVRAVDVRVPGAPMGRVIVMDDMTAEREMMQTQHDFVAMIGHELRTPLTIVKGFSRMLLKRADKVSPEDMTEALTTIDQKAAQLERLIEDLLYVSKIESREATLRTETVNVADMIEATATEVLEAYPEREVKLDGLGGLMWPCDREKVSLVVRHLVENALKYSEGPEPVIVRFFEDGDELHVDVKDRGMGIVSSDIPHVFERFRQLDGSSTREHGGTGVGLYLCAQLIKVHEGRIWVDSAWGKGSTFSFVLPRRAIKSEVVSLRSPGVSRTA